MGYGYAKGITAFLLCAGARCGDGDAPQAVEVPNQEYGTQVCPLTSPTSPSHTVPCGFCEKEPRQYECFYCIEGSTCIGDLCGNEGSCDTSTLDEAETQGECEPAHHQCTAVGPMKLCCADATLCCVKSGFGGIVKCCAPMSPNGTAYFACGVCVGTKEEAVGRCGRDGIIIACGAE